MGKRFWSLSLSLALVAGVFAALPASAADGSDAKFFLRSAGCPAAGGNFDYLSVTDADEEIECFHTGSGIRNEIGNETGTIGANGSNAVADRATATRFWDTTDGGPLSLDASRPVTGQLFTTGGECPVGGVPCSPAGAGAGEVILDIELVGISGGTEIQLGTQVETFVTNPGAPHLTELSIQPNASFTGTVFETIELRTWIHGPSAGHGVVKTNGDYSSFISVPTAASGTVLTPVPAGKNDPPGKGKKKGCGKGSGQKKGACPGKKPGKPAKPPVASSCPAYVPGEEGATAKTTLVTDAATAEKPVVVELDSQMGLGAMPIGGTPVPYDETTRVFQNVQVDTAGADTGLYARLEFPEPWDYDLYLNYPDGSEGDHSGDFSTIANTVFSCGGTSCESSSTSEAVLGLRTSDCGGWTAEMVSYISEGGPVTLSLWLGDVLADPAPAGGEAEALTTFYGLTGMANPSAPARMDAGGTPAANKGCTKGKGKKKGCKKPPVACSPFTPGELGAEKPNVILTDAATEEAPVEQTINLAGSVADADLVGEIPDEGPLVESYDQFNVQIDSASSTVGLYALFEFPERRDYDLELLHVDGSYAARSHDFNPICGQAVLSCSNEGHGGEGSSASEKLVGIATQDCGGWTVETVNWLGEGGEMTVKLWLGEIVNQPLAQGAEPHA